MKGIQKNGQFPHWTICLSGNKYCTLCSKRNDTLLGDINIRKQTILDEKNVVTYVQYPISCLLEILHWLHLLCDGNNIKGLLINKKLI